MEMKIYQYNSGHMTKMAVMLVYVISFKNPLPRNQRKDYKETQYVAPGIPVHHSLFKLWPWVDLAPFFANVKFWNLSFYIENCDSAACDLEIGWCT